MSGDGYDLIKKRVGSMKYVTSRPMFGYLCFSINKKVFAGFSYKNNQQIIVRLSKDQQEIAIQSNAIKPFRHGARTGWIEIDLELTTAAAAAEWILKGYENSKKLAKTR